MIVKVHATANHKAGYELKSHTGKNLGVFPTKVEALHREAQVQYFKSHPKK